jgi:hypothetical protein
MLVFLTGVHDLGLGEDGLNWGGGGGKSFATIPVGRHDIRKGSCEALPGWPACHASVKATVPDTPA